MPFLRRRQEDESQVSAAAPPPAETPPLEPPAATPAEPLPTGAPLGTPLLGGEAPAEPAVESQFQPVEGADEMLDMPLGTLIFRAGLIAPQQLEDALAEGLRSGKRLGEVLLARGWLSEEDLSRLLAGQKGLPYTDVERVAVDYELARMMSYEDAQREQALPLVTEFGVPVVAMCDPDEEAMERLREQIGPETRFVVAAPSALARLIDEVLGGTGAPAAPLLTQPGAEAEEAPLEEAAPVAEAEEAAAEPVVEEPVQGEEVVPIIAEGEIDYPNFGTYDTIPVPETLGTPTEQLPPDVQMGEYGGYFESDSSLLEGSAWQPGESGPTPEEQPPEITPPTAAEHAGYDIGYETEQVQEVEPLEAESTAPESAEEQPEESAQRARELPATPAWMRGEVNVITADVADFIDSSTQEAEAAVSQPVEEQELPAADLEPGVESGEYAEPATAEAAERAYEVAEPAESELVGEEMTVEPVEESTRPVAGEPGDSERGEYELVLRLSDGDRVPIGAFGSIDEAQAQASEIVKQFTDAKEGSWPFIGGRYLRPETIVSIDIEHHATGWGGSGHRGRMFSGSEDQ